MDDALREQIRTLAEQHGLDPAVLESAFSSGDMPEELEQAMTLILGDISLFHQALGDLDTKK